MTDTSSPAAIAPQELADACAAAAQAIPPAFPLGATVAVNPFLGQSGEPLEMLNARLGRIAGASAVMSRDWYAARLADDTITEADLDGALATAGPGAVREDPPITPAELRAATADLQAPARALPTVADLAADASGTDWPGLIADRIGAFAAGYFDEGQALWAAPRAHGLYSAWQAMATHDLTPEIAGLAGFARHVADAPQTATGAIARSARRLGLSRAALGTYFHQLLLGLGGWSQLARYRLWQAELRGGTDAAITDLLAIRLVWEEALLILHETRIADDWAQLREAHAAPVMPSRAQCIDALLQLAAERAAQRGLAATLTALGEAAEPVPGARPALQAAFCIDVRSEVFRRALEGVAPDIETLGFAGFFGLTAAHRGFASDVEERRLPVLLTPGLTSVTDADAQADRDARIKARAKRAWGRFKQAAVSSFAFVEAAGPLHAGSLLRDSLGLVRTREANGAAPRLDPPIAPDMRIDAAERILRAMSLTGRFARLVVLAGHGAKVVNNPHSSALQCGACGGHSGEVNARLLTGLLNDAAVRDGLAARGIEIPADTLFLGALHDTASDAVMLFVEDVDASGHAADIARARDWLTRAGTVTRAERALRLPGARAGAELPARGRDWAQVRPEWGLAGCTAFIAAPRQRTAGRRLEGRAFLHDYDWTADRDFGVLELILTAPVVVASWISLQYYGSTVVPQLFGAGNKLLHNVTGGVGVVEGSGGLMRAGLPWQSVHDGEKFIHEPLRLSVCVEAPREAISASLARHDSVRALFDNGWLHLFSMDETGALAWRYGGEGHWIAEQRTGGSAQRLRAAV